MKLFLDFETWSSIPIRRGSDVYLDAAAPLLLTYAIGDEAPKVHDFTTSPGMPFKFTLALEAADEIWAHNAFFDRNVLRKCLGLVTDIRRWRCSQALALAHGLPGGLGALCEVLGVPQELAKIADGRRLILKFCCKKYDVPRDEDWQKFIQYALNDITAMRECIKRIPNWNYLGQEVDLWHVDQIINNRGFAVDTALAAAAVEALGKNKTKLDSAVSLATSGSVSAATQRDKLLVYLCEQQGVMLPNLRASTVKDAIEDESLSEDVRNLLRLRLEASKTSTSKFASLQRSVGKGNRLRNTTQYCGASRTGRWAGRIFQPQNLPRPTMHLEDIRHCVELMREGRADIVPLFAPVGEAASNVVRGLIVAEPGKRLFVADYNSIEARVNAWLAGEAWVLKAFAEGQDLYKLTYAKSFNTPADTVTKDQRFLGKVQVLALGYGGGVGAFTTMASAYGMDLEELGRTVVPEEESFYAWDWAVKEDKTFGLEHDAYIACDTLKILYRRANSEIVKFWHMLDEAARNVIAAKNAKKRISIGRVILDCNQVWLRIQLPSGRFLCYASPQIHADNSISYVSWKNKKWVRTRTYGGKFCENLCQAVSRDVLGNAIVNAERAGYPIVLHIHDEIVSEVGPGTKFANFMKLVTTKPEWAHGLPISAEGFESTRYEKR